MTNQLMNLENKIQEFKKPLTESIVLAIQRTGTEKDNALVNSIIFDVCTEFKHTSLEDIQQAIRNGSLGRYGKTYKLTVQEVCIWIREYKEEKNQQYQKFQ